MPISSLNIPSESQIFMNRFIIRLRYYREEKNLSQAEMAERLQIGLRSYHRYESGESTPPLHLLYPLAKILEVNPEDLITEKVPLNHDWVTIYEGAEKKIFEEDPLVKASKIFDIFHSEEFKKALNHHDLTLLRENPLFKSSKHSLYLANPKYCLLNPFAKKAHGHKSDLVQATQAYDQLKLQGDHWAYLFGKKKCYVQTIHYPEMPTGRFQLICKYIFVSHSHNFYSLGVCENVRLD